MITAGILLKSNLCRIVTLSGLKKQHIRIAEKFHKLEIAPNPTQEDVEVFVQALKAYCNDNSIDIMVINFRNSTGDHAGGAASFRMEGIILAASDIPVKQAHPSTISASTRKYSNYKSIKPTTIELGRAYDLAFEGLE